jgi:sodium-dependent dicarboxylate transporter 2/3/5
MSAQDVRDTSPDELLLHEEEPQGPTQSTKAMIIKLLIALGLFLFIYFLPRPENLPVEGHKLGAILLPIVFLWVSEAIPIGITALLATALMIIFKVTGSSQA